MIKKVADDIKVKSLKNIVSKILKYKIKNII